MSDPSQPAAQIDRAGALRTRADKQRQKAVGGIAAAGGHFLPGVMARSPEAAMAANLADAFERIAIETEAGAPI